jgi:hypothetical protein
MLVGHIVLWLLGIFGELTIGIEQLADLANDAPNIYKLALPTTQYSPSPFPFSRSMGKTVWPGKPIEREKGKVVERANWNAIKVSSH